MPMRKISVEEAREIATQKGLKPGRVMRTDNMIQFTRGGRKYIEIISWERFEKDLKERDLAVYESKGFMKIMQEEE